MQSPHYDWDTLESVASSTIPKHLQSELLAEDPEVLKKLLLSCKILGPKITEDLVDVHTERLYEICRTLTSKEMVQRLQGRLPLRMVIAHAEVVHWFNTLLTDFSPWWKLLRLHDTWIIIAVTLLMTFLSVWTISRCSKTKRERSGILQEPALVQEPVPLEERAPVGEQPAAVRQPAIKLEPTPLQVQTPVQERLATLPEPPVKQEPELTPLRLRTPVQEQFATLWEPVIKQEPEPTPRKIRAPMQERPATVGPAMARAPTPLEVQALVQEPQRRPSTRSTSDGGRLISLDNRGKRDGLLKWKGPRSARKLTMQEWREGSR